MTWRRVSAEGVSSHSQFCSSASEQMSVACALHSFFPRRPSLPPRLEIFPVYQLSGLNRYITTLRRAATAADNKSAPLLTAPAPPSPFFIHPFLSLPPSLHLCCRCRRIITTRSVFFLLHECMPRCHTTVLPSVPRLLVVAAATAAVASRYSP